MGWTPATGNFSTKMTIPTVNVKEAGYIFVYLSYEDAANAYVYFDNMNVTYTPGNIVQSNEYYPFGLQSKNSWTRDNTTNNFLYDAGGEINATTGWYDLPYRNYDPALGRFMQVDALAHRSHNLTPYHYAGDNPTSANDPTGLVEVESDGSEGFSYEDDGSNDWGEDSSPIEDSPATSGGGIQVLSVNYSSDGTTALAAVIGEDGNTYAVQINYDANGNVGSVVATNGILNSDGSMSIASSPSIVLYDGQSNVSGISFYSIEGIGDMLDPSTIGHNLFGLTYAGGNNPKTFKGADDYSYKPSNMSDPPAIGHDRRYDNLHASGDSDLFFNTKTVGADWQFVGEEFVTFGNQYNSSIDRLDAFVLGVGLGAAALTKTAFKLCSGPGSVTEIMEDYAASNVGVTNEPSH